MLDHIILEQLKRREAEARRRRSPEVTLELPRPMPAAPPKEENSEEGERGVVVFDIL